jgi:hypothetical protein
MCGLWRSPLGVNAAIQRMQTERAQFVNKKKCLQHTPSALKKGPGSDFPPIFFVVVFLNSPHRETPKNVIKQNRGARGKKQVLDFLSIFL